MHPSSFENMQKCYERFVRPSGLDQRASIEVLDVGGANVNGSYRDLFQAPNYHYRSADIASENVDIVLGDPCRIPLGDATIDIVISGQMLEHCELFWLTFQEMVRVMKPDGFLFLIAPSAGPIHRYPVDCYRFYPDAYSALARWAGCHLHAVWRDERGPWRDLVGVFRKTPLSDDAETVVKPFMRQTPAAPPMACDASAEIVRGEVPYREILKRVHEALGPGSYLEIGVREGDSLRLANCPAIGVDPFPSLTGTLSPGTEVIAATSDDFFEFLAPARLMEAPDLVFIDGMHLFEYALRDFMHVERYASPRTLVVVDDVLPCHPKQARRERETRVWTGDVWKLHACLRRHRPDLFLLVLDSYPTGLLLIAGLDNRNRVLWDGYNPIVRHFRDEVSDVPPDTVLRRKDAHTAPLETVTALGDVLASIRDSELTAEQVSATLGARV